MNQSLAEWRIVRQLAVTVAQRICRKAIAALHDLTNGLQFGDDSSLSNAWEEICVQVQGEQSVLWDIYIETMQKILVGYIDKLEPYEREALWLQTPQGEEWDAEDENEREAYPIAVDGIIDYLIKQHLLTAADGWSNKRIRKYLDL